MKETEHTKAYYYFDKAGDPQILGKKGVNLVAQGKASKVFMVGYLETKNPKAIREAFLNLQKEIISDDYLAMIPSVIDSTAKNVPCLHGLCRSQNESLQIAQKPRFHFLLYCCKKKKKLHSEINLN